MVDATASFFADSYAIIEILRGNLAYRRYSSAYLVTTEFNLCEVAYAVFKDFPEESASILSTVRTTIEVVPTWDADYVVCAELRLQNNRSGKKLSTIDSLGYAVAQRLAIQFLTGDREFSDMKNVRFVK